MNLYVTMPKSWQEKNFTEWMKDIYKEVEKSKLN